MKTKSEQAAYLSDEVKEALRLIEGGGYDDGHIHYLKLEPLAKAVRDLAERLEGQTKSEWYTCHQCRIGHSTDNMSATCAACSGAIISDLNKENKSLREKLKDVLPLIRYTANQCHSKCVCNGQHSGMMSWCAGVENLINEYDRVSNDVKRELPGYNPPAKHPREWPE